MPADRAPHRRASGSRSRPDFLSTSRTTAVHKSRHFTAIAAATPLVSDREAPNFGCSNRQRRRPLSFTPHCGNALQHRPPLASDRALLECNDGKHSTDHAQQLAFRKQKPGIRRLAVSLVAGGKGFVEQQTVACHGAQELWKKGAMQIVGHYNHVKTRCAERPCAGLEIVYDCGDSGDRGEPRQRLRIAIDCSDTAALARKEQAMSSVAAGDVENVRSCFGEWRKSNDPRRRTRDAFVAAGAADGHLRRVRPRVASAECAVEASGSICTVAPASAISQSMNARASGRGVPRGAGMMK